MDPHSLVPAFAPARRGARPAARAGRAGAVTVTLLAAAIAVAGCDVAPRSVAEELRTSTAPTPAAEFVVTTGDSTFWVRSGPEGVAVRGSPILLARVDGRFYELYVVDDDRSYRDAVFVGQQLWKRDVVTNDSSLVWADATMPALADAWAAANPSDRLLAPGEPESEEPLVSAVIDVSVLDVVGPYLSLEWFADVHPLDEAASHRLRRDVLDLRTGRPVSLAELVGAGAADELVGAGGREFARLSDSLALAESDESAGIFRFDATSFALGVEAGRPAIAFLAPAEGDARGDVGGVPLQPLPVTAPVWWDAARPERPEPASGGFEDRWGARAGIQLVARYDSTDGQAQLMLLGVPTRPDARGSVTARGAEAVEAVGRSAPEWPLLRLTPPLLRVYWLDGPALSTSMRRALTRAFDEADRYESDLPYPELPGRLAAGPAVSRLPFLRSN